MSWFNYLGLIFTAIILVPNIVYAIKHRGEPCKDIGKLAFIGEQAGRYGCIVFMIFNIPYLYFNFWFDGAIIAYIAINSFLTMAYITCWLALGKTNGRARSITLSVLPSCIFFLSGLLLLNIPLIVFSGVFAYFHISISVRTAA